jgi:hypothetical protein
MALDSYQRTMLIISIIGASASLASMFFTASIALKCNGKLVRKLEEKFGFPIAE